jgi:hypothetical protein
MELLSAVVTLFLVMGTLGNDLLFLGLLKTVAPKDGASSSCAKSRWLSRAHDVPARRRLPCADTPVATALPGSRKDL